MKKIYSTPVSVETKTRIRASILAGSTVGPNDTPNGSGSSNLNDANTLDPNNDALGARTRMSID